MTIDRIGTGQISNLAGLASSPGGQLAGAQHLARSVVAGIASAFGLVSAGPAVPQGYAVRETADALAAELGATPAQTGELERAVERFAGAVAADMAAFADGRTLDRVDAALAEGAVFANADDAIRFFDQASDRIETAR